MGNTVEVVAGIIWDGDRVLACRRLPSIALGGLWEFPGGKIELGETAEEALIRELQEELAVHVTVEDRVCTSETLQGDRTISLQCFNAKLMGAPPQSSTDHDDLRWLLVEDLLRLSWAPADMLAVEILLARD